MAIIIKLLLFFFITGCTSLIYQPDRVFYGDPRAYGIEVKEFSVQSYDGTKLFAWELKSKEKAENLVLMFHGNAQNLTSHVFNLAWITKNKTDVLIFDYRGYGLSEGTPYPQGVLMDGLKFLEVAYDQFKSGYYKRFIIYAQSLGGAVAMRALEEVPWADHISLLVLDSTFRSPQDIAYNKTHGLLGWLISGESTAQKKLGHLTMPLLVIHAPNDPVISYQFGEQIYKTAPSKNKVFWRIDKGLHGDIFFVENGKYRQQFLNHIKNL